MPDMYIWGGNKIDIFKKDLISFLCVKWIEIETVGVGGHLEGISVLWVIKKHSKKYDNFIRKKLNNI